MRRSEKLPREEVQKMFYKLSQSIAGIDNISDTSALLQGLLSFSEAEMIAKRLSIATELIDGKKYHHIRDQKTISDVLLAKILLETIVNGATKKQQAEI